MFLATTTTLKSLKAQITEQLGITSEQESKILRAEIYDVIYNTMLHIRSAFGKMLNPFYRTVESLTFTGSKPEYTVNISTLLIYDINEIKLYHDILQHIPIFSKSKYEGYKQLYSPSEVGIKNSFATTYSTIERFTPPGGSEIILSSNLYIVLYSNIGSAPENVKITYSRNPVKNANEDSTLDIPENFIAILRDVSTLHLAKRIEKKPSIEVHTVLANNLAILSKQFSIPSIIPQQMVQ